MKLKDLEPRKLMRKNVVHLDTEKLPRNFLLNGLPRKVIKNILNEYAEFEIKEMHQYVKSVDDNFDGKIYQEIYIEVE